MARSGKHTDLTLGRFSFDDIRKQEQCFRLQALCHIHQNLPCFQIGCKISHGLCNGSGRNRQNHDIRAVHSLLAVGGCLNGIGNHHTGEIFLICSFFQQLIHCVLSSGPDENLMSVFRQHHCKGCPPAAGTNDCYLFHKL